MSGFPLQTHAIDFFGLRNLHLTATNPSCHAACITYLFSQFDGHLSVMETKVVKLRVASAR